MYTGAVFHTSDPSSGLCWACPSSCSPGSVTVHRSQIQALDQVALVPEVQTSSRKVSQSLSPRGFHRSKARLLSKASCPSGV